MTYTLVKGIHNYTYIADPVNRNILILEIVTEEKKRKITLWFFSVNGRSLAILGANGNQNVIACAELGKRELNEGENNAFFSTQYADDFDRWVRMITSVWIKGSPLY